MRCRKQRASSGEHDADPRHPTPITAVLDIPAGRIQFIASDRADTTVEVASAIPAKSRVTKVAEHTTATYAEVSCGSRPRPRATTSRDDIIAHSR
ncbi:hypothetical protein ACRS5S_02560 [Nocardia asiatica]|uniref:hypothetical protein n=1 Tax=Nocardia asiatica TaxID=209252 RepID=UPI003EE3942B